MSFKERIKAISTHPVTRRSAWIAVAALFIALCAPTPAHAQFDGAGLLIPYIEQLNSMMQASLGVPLSAIDATTAQFNQFTQQTVYPQAQLQQFQQLATGFAAKANSGAGIVQVSRSSSLNNLNQGFETALLSGDPNQASAVPAYYTQTYGTNVTTNIPPQIQTIVDMNDALAQDAMKRAIQMDAVSTQELNMVQQLLTQASSASSGTAPILTVQADAWLVQANAYSQLAESDLLRVQAGQLATTSAMYKLGSSGQSNTLNAFTGTLGGSNNATSNGVQGTKSH
jgi:hypothetical protein